MVDFSVNNAKGQAAFPLLLGSTFSQIPFH